MSLQIASVTSVLSFGLAPSKSFNNINQRHSWIRILEYNDRIPIMLGLCNDLAASFSF